MYDPVVPLRHQERLGLTSGLSFVENPFVYPPAEGYDAVILAVPHRPFRQLGWGAYRSLFGGTGPGVFVDVRGVFSAGARDGVLYWSL